jgi:hypothetical protein
MMAYTTAALVRARMQKSDAGDDAIITALITAAERAINNFCNRPDGFEADAAASARYYSGNGQGHLLIDECVEIAAVAVKEDVTDTDYEAWSSPTTNMAGDGDWFACTGDREAPDFNSLPYTMLMVDPNGDYTDFTDAAYSGLWGFRTTQTTKNRGLPTVKVTAKWGYSAAVPQEIAEACAMQTMRWYKRGQSAMASVLATADLGSLEIYPTLDPDIEFILRLGRYIKPTTGRA